MSTTFQPGQHPDADQLSAFAEHALPLPEQQATLAHLANCADCRAIVFLAQSAAPEITAQIHPVAARRTWFAGWMLAFPAAAALAALVFVTVHLHSSADQSQPAPAVTSARNETAPPLPATAPTQPVLPPPPAAAQQKQAQPLPAPSPEVRNADNIAGIARLQPAPQPQTLTGSLGGTAQGLDSATSPAAGPLSEKKALQPTVSQAAFAPPVPAAATAQQAVPVASAADSARSEASNRQDVQNLALTGRDTTELLKVVPAASGTAADQLSTSERTTSQAVVLPALPSKLPTLAVATSSQHRLAIDTAGALFRSDDAGVTWLLVPTQWTGRAIKLALLPSANARPLAYSAGALAAKPAAPPPPVFQLTTDAGDLWTSSDGQTWKRK